MGVKASRVIIETCSRLHIACLTLYAFSVENWRRPQTEVEFLMRLLREYLKRELPTMQKNNIRLLFIGRSNNLPQAVRDDMEESMQLTARNTGMRLVLAINYGARAEIVDAVNAILSQARARTQTFMPMDEQCHLRASVYRRAARPGSSDSHER